MATATATTVKVGKDELRRALSICKGAVANHTPAPVLKNVLLADNLMTATDNEVRVQVDVDYEGEPLLLPHDRLSAIVSVCESPVVSLSLDEGNRCRVTSGKGRWMLPTQDPAEFPAWDVTPKKTLPRIPADQFARAVGGTHFATDSDGSRYALGAVLVTVVDDALMFVATDGRRLAEFQCGYWQDLDKGEWLVPARVMELLRGIAQVDSGNIQLEATDNEFVASVGGVVVTCRLVNGAFPKWRDVAPKRQVERTLVRAADLLMAVRQAGVVTSESSKGVDFSFGPNGISLKGKSAEYGESSVRCDVEKAGEQCTARLNPHYVAQWLKNSVDHAEVIEIDAKDGESAVVFYASETRYVVMPMALD